MMEKLMIDRKEADIVQKTVSIEEAEATKQADQAEAIKQEAALGVADANLKLEKSVALIKQLNKTHIEFVKAIKMPTPTVKLVIAGVMIMLGEQPDLIPIPGTYGKKEEEYFVKCKRVFMNDPKKFLALLLDFADSNKNNIPLSRIKKLGKEIVVSESFNEKDSKKSCEAIMYLYYWVSALYDYDQIYKST